MDRKPSSIGDGGVEMDIMRTLMIMEGYTLLLTAYIAVDQFYHHQLLNTLIGWGNTIVGTTLHEVANGGFFTVDVSGGSGSWLTELRPIVCIDKDDIGRILELGNIWD